MQRVVFLLYGVVCYLVFLVSFVYAIGFVGNLVVPKSIDSGLPGPVASALVINALLLGLFAVQHSVMARHGFKKVWTKVIPNPIERSTYVLLSSLILILMYWQWRPMPDSVWQISNVAGRTVLQALCWIGWLIVLVSTFIINHFDLFGLRQVVYHAQRKELTPLPFTKRGLYKLLRHPIMLGFIIAFWSTPDMSLGHLIFAIATTGYIIVGILLEERDMVVYHGKAYEAYRREVPMLVPGTKMRPGGGNIQPTGDEA
ncbi:MAG: methanethiol S-methyltransferase [Candidatus Zixiibacteriota bacterium]